MIFSLLVRKKRKRASKDGTNAKGAAAKGKHITKKAKVDEKDKKPAETKKDPNAPKRPVTAYICFNQAARAKLKEENPELSFGELGKLVGQKYKELAPEEKAKYDEKVSADKKRYEREMAEYSPPGLDSDGDTTKKSKPKPKIDTAKSLKTETSKKKNSKDKADEGSKTPTKKQNSKDKADEGDSKTPTSTVKADDEELPTVNSEDNAKMEEAKKEAGNLKRKADRIYKKCVEEIEKMTEDNLPRKPKRGTSKCQVTVPEGKSSGDGITIS